MGNSSDDSQLKYTVCGVPVPTVKWGFLEKNIKNSVIATKRNDTYYAHDYVLNVTADLCEKVLYFKADGYNGKICSWKKKIRKRCKSYLYIHRFTETIISLYNF